MLILQETVNEYWFSGRFLSVSNALCQVANNLGDLLGNFTTPLIYLNERSIELPLFVGGCVCLLSAMITIWYYFIHRSYDDHHKDKLEEDGLDPNDKELGEYFALVRKDPTFKLEFGFKSVKYFNTTFWLLCAVYLCLANAIV